MLPKTLQRLTHEISALRGVDKIILFGSRARGDNSPFSDIDLAISGVQDDVLWASIRQKADVERSGTLLKIDLVRLEEADSALKASILKEGKVLYERR